MNKINAIKKLIQISSIDEQINAYAQTMLEIDGNINSNYQDYIDIILESSLLSKKWLRWQDEKTKETSKKIKRLCNKIRRSKWKD